MHIQRICGQSRLVTHCVLEGLGVCLTIAPRVGTVKLARVGRSLLEPDATGERAVRLPPTAPGPFNLAFLPPSRAEIFDYCQASRWKLFGSYLRRRRKSVSSLAMESDGKVLRERKRLEKSEETLFCYFQRHFVFHHVCSFEKCSDGPLSRILHTMNRYIDRRCRTSMLRFFQRSSLFEKNDTKRDVSTEILYFLPFPPSVPFQNSSLRVISIEFRHRKFLARIRNP